MSMTRLVLGLCVAGALFAPAAQAADDDRFTVRLSAFQPEASLRLRGTGTATDGTDSETVSEAGTLDIGRETRPRGSVMFRMSERQRLIGNLYDYERNEGRDWGGGFVDPADYGFEGDPVEIPEVSADSQLKFRLASLNYEFAVVNTEQFVWGLGAGITHARLEAGVSATSSGTAELDPESTSAGWNKSEWSPNLHTRFAWQPTEKWVFSVEGQYLDTRWGDFTKERGHFERGGVLAEYRISERVGVHVGYDWFRLKLADDFEGSVGPFEEAGVDQINYAGTLTGTLKVHGPMAGITFAF